MASSGALLGTVLGAVLVLLSLGLVSRYGWNNAPDPSYGAETTVDHGEGVANRHSGPMYESDVADAETEPVDTGAFDPVGTVALLAVYFAVVALAWLFMYFVEFLGNGPTVVG